jgi:hypothetical protein
MGTNHKHEGVRKDSISHGIRSSIMAMGGYPAYFLDMRTKLPTKFADMVSKYIPQEIEQTTKITHNVLICNFPEPRAINTSEPVQLEQTPCASAESASEIQGVIIDVDAGVEPTDLLPVTADAGVSAPDEECEE